MSVAKSPVVTALSAGHPLGQVNASVPVANAGDAAGQAFALGSGTTITAGTVRGGAVNSGLTAAGFAAVCTAVGTYISGLSAAKKLQLGNIQADITQTGFEVPVHSADVATFTATLVTLLNTSTNFGPIGT